MTHRMLALMLIAALALPHAAGAHGGGCRKSSPKGQCCHMETKTGKAHCHIIED